MTEKTTADRIESLILQTDDPKDKALLLTLLEMSKSLVENTDLTKQLHAEFKTHAMEEVALIVKGRFLWRVLLAIALTLQIGLGWLFTRHEASFDRLASDVEELKVFRAEHRAHHDQEEKWRDGPKIK